MQRDGELWVVILAGGEGRRLRELIREPDGTPVPKQFCRFDGGESLLQRALGRAVRLARPENVLTVVMEEHRRWWGPELIQHPQIEPLPQPIARGTGVAVLHALVEILLRDRGPLIAILPSDHVANDETALDGAVAEAIAAARELPEELVVLGMPSESPDPEYGWLLPMSGPGGTTRGVISLEEKPLPDRAADLLAQGALVNSFIICATGWAMLDLFRRTRAEVLQAYIDGREASAWKTASLDRVFRRLPVLDFTLDLVAESLPHLRVLPGPCCGWVDLGTPERILRWRDRLSQTQPAS